MTGPKNLTDALAFYAQHNLKVTPVARGAKSGRLKGWSAPGHNATPADFHLGDNIAVLNGTDVGDGWYFHDVDLDLNSDGARKIARRLLPATGWIYGREGKRDSHYGYLVHGEPLRTRQYKGIDGSMLIELRGITQKKTHSLSVAPGSTHESGEAITFREPVGPIGRVDKPDALDAAVQHAAVALVIYTIWPDKGSRHDLRLAFAKVLIDHGLSVERVRAILEAVMEATGSDVADVARTVNDTHVAIQAGQPTAGASTVLSVLGEETGQKVLDTIARMLRSGAIDGIVMTGGKLTEIVDRAEAALLASPTPIYQRGGMLTRTVKIDRPVGDEGAVRRAAGSTVLAAVKEPWLLEQMGRVAPWYRPTTEGPQRSDPQAIYARTLMARGEWRFPVLRGILKTPTITMDGRIIEKPGYDAESGLLLDFAPGSFPEIPKEPTKATAAKMLEALCHPLRAFPFVDDAARSVALSAMITSLVRPCMRTAPAHAFDAPTAGTGKSLLTEMVGLLATGVEPAVMNQGKSEEEDEKRLSTVLFAGDPVIVIDNCDREVSGDFVCSMLTQSVVQARILGQSERRIMPCLAVVIFNGNNMVFAGDVSRRVVICRLDAGVERPDAREFDFDCRKELLQYRAALVVAALTILRAYIVAGMPAKLTPMGSFEDWSWIRGALVWLGCADPADTRLAIIESDPRKDELSDVMDLWEEIAADNPIYVADINAEELGETAYVPLRAKLTEVACSRTGKWNGKSVGWWLKRHMGRIVAGRSFKCAEDNRGHKYWYLAGAKTKVASVEHVEAVVHLGGVH